MQKNEEYVVDVIDNGIKGEGIAKVENKTIFIPKAIKGEKILIKILKVKENIAFGKILEILEKSEIRKQNDCKFYDKCGGCDFRHIKYEESLEIKKKSVQTTLYKSLGKNINIDEVIGMENPKFYRNKLQYPIGVNSEGQTVMGIFAERSHRIIEIDKCLIQNEKCQEVANNIYKFLKENNISGYNEKTGKGIFRHIIVRIGLKTNEIMVTLVVNNFNIPKEDKLIEYILNKNPEIVTIAKNLNNKNTNVILGNKTEIIYGRGYIFDYIGDKKFKISPLSFYQVNPIQTVKLYSKAIEYAELSGNETIFDLYCGIGTIGICASDRAKKIYGIETIKEAIEDAKENANLNKIENAEFFAGDVENILPRLVKERKLEADVVFLDPPRKGCDKITLETLLKVKSKKIVYVSCNPATLARDLKILEEKYEIKRIAICDMFPGTGHVECCSVLYLKDSIQ